MFCHHKRSVFIIFFITAWKEKRWKKVWEKIGKEGGKRKEISKVKVTVGKVGQGREVGP